MLSDNKRAFKRIKKSFRILCIPEDSLAPKSISSFTENISLGGLFFICLEKMNIGQRVTCNIDLDNQNSIKIFSARVVRCEDMKKNMIKTYGIALEFINVDHSIKKMLKKAIEPYC